jgi:putative hemolysin
MQSDFLLLIFLIILSGFFSSAETALFSIGTVRSRHISKKGGKINKLIKQMKEDPHKLLSTILIGNNLVNIGASALATAITIELAASHAVGIATGIMTAIILIFGEIFPKSIATHNNIAIAKAVILPIYWLSILFSPLIFLLKFIPQITNKVKRVTKVTEEELLTFVEVVEEEGEIKEEEKELIHNIFQFDDTHSSEIMQPRADMFVIDADEDLDLVAILKSGFTRIPVIEGDIDHVVGILNIKSLFMEQIKTDGKVDVRKIMKAGFPSQAIPEKKTAHGHCGGRVWRRVRACHHGRRP